MTLLSGSVFLLWALFSWQGGLHAWQHAVAASIGLGLLARQDVVVPVLTRRERWAAALLAVAAAAGFFSAFRPQAHLNAAFALAALFLLFVAVRRSGLRSRAVLLFWGWLALAFSAGFLLQHYLLGVPFLAAVRALFPNQNLLSADILVPGALGLLWMAAEGRRSAWVGFIVLAITVDRLASRGALLAFVCGAAWLLWRADRGRAQRRVLLLAAAGWLALTTVGPRSGLAERFWAAPKTGSAQPSFTTDRRPLFWSQGLALASARPWLGYGLQGFKAAVRHSDMPVELSPDAPIARYRLELDHAHSDWIELAVELGWPFAALVYACVLIFLWDRRHQGRAVGEQAALEAAVVAVLAHAWVDMPLRTPAVLLGLTVSLAVLSGPPTAEAAARRSGRSGPFTWVLAVYFLFSLGRTVAVRIQRGAQSELALSAVHCLQPFDAVAEARRSDMGKAPWPWSDWSGRHEPDWLWARARSRAGDRDPSARLGSAERAVAERPYWAPGWYWLGLLQGELGRPEAQRSMQKALQLEPNFARVRAWQVEQAFKAGHVAEARDGLHAIQRIQSLRMVGEEPGTYTRYIQGLEPGWLEKWDKKLKLSTIFRRPC